jgi:hypothetical protein
MDMFSVQKQVLSRRRDRLCVWSVEDEVFVHNDRKAETKNDGTTHIAITSQQILSALWFSFGSSIFLLKAHDCSFEQVFMLFR